MLGLLLPFLSGILALALFEIALLAFLLHRFLRPRPPPSPSSPRPSSLSIDGAASTARPPHLSLKGDVWVVPPSQPGKDTVKVLVQRVKVLKESKRKRDGTEDFPEVCPVRRHARLEDHTLLLTADDGTEECIDLDGCSVLSVSGGNEVSRKWAKKYPIKLEIRDRKRPAGSLTYLLYLETGWEKEAWCQVLRAASKWDINTGGWYTNLRREFHEYSLRLNEAYPAFPKLSPSRSDYLVDEKGKISKPEVGLSRRQKLWKRLTKKGSSKESKSGSGHGDSTGSALESKSGSGHGDSKGSALESKSGSGHGELNPSVPLQAQAQADGGSQEKPGVNVAGSSHGQLNFDSSRKLSTPDTKSKSDDINKSSSTTKGSSQAASLAAYGSSAFQKDLDELVSSEKTKIDIDHGAMCWNMLFSRLFFDFYHSSNLNAVCQRLIQKQLSKITTPAYIGGINCTSLELGTTPPFFHSMHILPTDSDGIWSFEAGIEYSGGALIKIETRLDVSDSISQENVVNQSLEPTLAGAAAADILRKGLESVEKNVGSDGNVARGANASESTGNLNHGLGDLKSSKSTGGKAWVQSSRAGWKSMLSHVADQVSQVPFTLSLRVVSLKGTLRVQVKAPPSNCIWVAFTSMPDIELKSEPSIGDHKITTGPVAAFITSRIKSLLEDALVLPNSENISVPWMISEKDDWIPQTAVPLPWSPNDMSESTSPEEAQAGGRSRDGVKSYTIQQTLPTADPGKRVQLPGNAFPVAHHFLAQSAIREYSPDLERPLLEKTDSASESALEGSFSQNDAMKQQEVSSFDNESSARFPSNDMSEEKGKQESKRAKMLSLGKKVGEKLDEKRRHMLGKMREGFERNEHSGGEF